LLDTNICSSHLKRPAGLTHRFIQYSGRLYIPSIVLAELYTWAYRRDDPQRLINLIENDLLADVQVLSFDADRGRLFGRLRGGLMNRGVNVGRIDLTIAAIALVHDFTLITHNTADFEGIPGLRLDDWIDS
jgi:tRNA(fMet)-specific endonuclease VapC